MFANARSSFCCARHKSQRNCKFNQKSGDVSKNLASRKAVLGVTPLLPLTSSLTRWYGTWISSANSRWVIPIGRRKSSRSISPGCVGALWVGILTIIVFLFLFILCDNPQSRLRLALFESTQRKSGIVRWYEYYADLVGYPWAILADCLGEFLTLSMRWRSPIDPTF